MTTSSATSLTTQSYYELLNIPQDATSQQIKQAYHRLLLLHHPDKRSASGTASPSAKGVSPKVDSPGTVDVALLTVAYSTLSSEERRKGYDDRLGEGGRTSVSQENELERKTRRPAEVVSLDEFTLSINEKGEVWTYLCRCGNLYMIHETDMEADVHLLECGGCSEVVWVEYEEAGEDITDVGITGE
ncbi:hypothetical protein DACRYDRAFT_65914 [Dacryopinax primogenitus]|uniref:Diphthamide biosynthesis protein 4 n=1 Tax=Dacryopinax primogenitus (strain DJM 731) TaxID=1858805 RepID=M5FXK1_DACPD|nr:uncharacterized protein DACRYDRAFT_65914 [Dacryopinax primogenitus]EJU02746.1 hypothetical protein DACRYDRAFT_65914 [Dacryopinax primogenitus]